MVHVFRSVLLLALSAVANTNAYIRAIRGRAIAQISGDGTITTIAGIEPNVGSALPGFSGDGGPATAAALSYPSGVAVDSRGLLYIADRVSVGSIVRIWAHVPRSCAGARDRAHGYLSLGVHVLRDSPHISPQYNSRVRVVARDSTIVTVAGAGSVTTSGLPATSIQLRDPIGIAVDRSDNLFIVDEVLLLVIKVDSVTQIATVVAGGGGVNASLGDGGPATAAALSDPSSVAVDRHGNLFVTESVRPRSICSERVACACACSALSRAPCQRCVPCGWHVQWATA